MASYTYQESVHWIREQPDLEQTVKDCYLDEDIIAAAQRFASSEEFAEIVKLLKLNRTGKPWKILDIGCGNGIVSYAFANLGHDVTAVDPDDSADVGLGELPRLTGVLKGGSITAVKAFAENLPLQTSEYDLVYTRQALHHFADLVKGLTECTRVLKPGGYLLATREHVVDDELQMQVFLRDHLLHKLHGGENAYPLKNYLDALQKAGLKIKTCFAPFDTVINHFPMPNRGIVAGAKARFARRLGMPLASILANTRLGAMYHRRRLSEGDKTAGRMYSFLCTKSR